MRIFLTGANGYIGKRLLLALLGNGHQVICMVRDARRFAPPNRFAESVEMLVGDLLKPETLDNIPVDIEAAYYLVHSMSQNARDFARLESESSENFSAAIQKTNARQIIYLGGISNDANLSPHLKSRLAVEKILQESGIPLTVLRAGIIIGAGSASFEIIRDLVEKLPVMVAPKWLKTKSQPIAIHDIIYYLTAVLGNPGSYGKTFEIGGPDILTYKQMLLEFAKIRGLKRVIITVPVLTPRISSYWLYLITATTFSLARSLVDSMKNEVICENNEIDQIIPHHCLSYQDAIRRAFSHAGEDILISSWKDAWVSGRLPADFGGYIEVPTHACYIDKQQVNIADNAQLILERIWRIGGETGWYYGNLLWGIRGFLDKLVGGIGLRRGRTNPSELNAGDALDFWRVLVADKAGMRLLLYAEMKLPGEAWLEFKIYPNQNGGTFQQTATFRPKGLSGRLYWYAMFPFHIFIFRRMAQRIAMLP